MRIPKLTKKTGMVLFGLFLIAFGSITLLVAQRAPAPQILRLTIDGSYLGIGMEDVTADNLAKYKLTSETGVIVRSVEKASPAEAARLQENDVILEYAGIPVFSAAELSRLVQETPVNRTVNLVVSRDGKKINLSAKLGERKGSSLSVRPNVLPRGPEERLFEFGEPGSGIFQFRLPSDRKLALGRLMPNFVGRLQLGVTIQTLTDQMGEFLGVPGKKGVLVTSVTAGSPAASVLRAGDVVISIDGKTASDPSDLTQALARKQPGDKVDLRIIRDKKEIAVSVEFPKSGTASQGIKV
jgi:serine protease Do